MKLVIAKDCPKWSLRELRSIATEVWDILRPDLTEKQRETVRLNHAVIQIRPLPRRTYSTTAVYLVPGEATRWQFAHLLMACLRARAGLSNHFADLPSGKFSNEALSRLAPAKKAKLSRLQYNERHLAELNKKLRVAEARVRRLTTLIKRAERADARERKRIAADDSTRLGTDSFAERMRLRREQPPAVRVSGTE